MTFAWRSCNAVQLNGDGDRVACGGSARVAVRGEVRGAHRRSRRLDWGAMQVVPGGAGCEEPWNSIGQMICHADGKSMAAIRLHDAR